MIIFFFAKGTREAISPRNRHRLITFRHHRQNSSASIMWERNLCESSRAWNCGFGRNAEIFLKHCWARVPNWKIQGLITTTTTDVKRGGNGFEGASLKTHFFVLLSRLILGNKVWKVIHLLWGVLFLEFLRWENLVSSYVCVFLARERGFQKIIITFPVKQIVSNHHVSLVVAKLSLSSE